MVMLATIDHLTALAERRRAQPFRLEYRDGLAGVRVGRTYTVFVPPTAEGMRALFDRVHNGIVLLQPGAVRIRGEVDAALVAPELTRLRSFHLVPILWGDEAEPAHVTRDLPSIDTTPPDPVGPGPAIGLDIGGTGMKACALSPRGALLRVASAPTWPDGEQGVDSLIRRARALIVEVTGETPGGSLGIGLAAPMGVGGKVLELSTVLRKKVGDAAAFDNFAARVAEGLVQGPVAIFNDLINLGRQRSATGARRLVRVQIGTSFGGCWIDVDGAVVATEMARLVIDASPDGRPHPYLPLRGVARAQLCNLGVQLDIQELTGEPVDVRESGMRLRQLLETGDPRGKGALDRLAASMRAAVGEMAALLPGILEVEVGGSMLQGPAGVGMLERLRDRTAVPVHISDQPGHDGAVAAASAPRVYAPLKAMRRVG